MLIVVWIFALITGLIHVVVFTWESLFIDKPFVRDKIFSVRASDVPAIRLWTFGLGFYNLFLGLGLFAGVIMWAMGYEVVGKTLVAYISLVLLLCGIVLFIGDRLGYGNKKGDNISGAFSQAVPPAVTLAAMAFV
ncbi:DUF1304 family protein [Corynebacterium sp. S7]